MKPDSVAYTVWLFLVAAVVLIGAVILASAANAQQSDRWVAPVIGGFTHVPEGMADPYPHECCHGRDCMPWPAEDVVPNGDGTYFIPSLGAKIGKGMIRPLTKEMSQLAIVKNGEATPYHLCVRRDPVTGDIVWNKGKVTVHCFFAGDGM